MLMRALRSRYMLLCIIWLLDHEGLCSRDRILSVGSMYHRWETTVATSRNPTHWLAIVGASCSQSEPCGEEGPCTYMRRIRTWTGWLSWSSCWPERQIFDAVFSPKTAKWLVQGSEVRESHRPIMISNLQSNDMKSSGHRFQLHQLLMYQPKLLTPAGYSKTHSEVWALKARFSEHFDQSAHAHHRIQRQIFPSGLLLNQTMTPAALFDTPCAVSLSAQNILSSRRKIADLKLRGDQFH